MTISDSGLRIKDAADRPTAFETIRRGPGGYSLLPAPYVEQARCGVGIWVVVPGSVAVD